MACLKPFIKIYDKRHAEKLHLKFCKHKLEALKSLCRSPVNVFTDVGHLRW